ncbi:diacylglycerol/lipid kinase family protein [Rhodospirillum centenum]|uniref:diacylglycerol/lipid kinase family protein n=1 Tax=Rhodospirillum centenum TaxID=34018 RepID=UPI0005A177DB|nr:diacylglycerol kinase family protein [Rhodospirillum centenum]
MKLCVILNSSAGSLLDMPVTDAIAEVEHGFRDAGHDVVCVASPGTDVPDAIRRALDRPGVDTIVVGGGDGTIVTAAHLLQGTGCTLGVLPLGTMNLLARDLGLPLDLPGAVQALAHGRPERIDMAEVNGHPFLNNSVIGWYPRMVAEREHQRGAHHIRKWPAMALAAVKTLVDNRRLSVEVDLGHGPQRIQTPILAVANNVYDGGFGPILRRSTLTAGKLGVYIAHYRSRFGLLALATGFAVGRWQELPGIDTHEVHSVTVHTRRRRRIKVANDGEVLELETPLRYRILPEALTVLRPASEEPASLRQTA